MTVSGSNGNILIAKPNNSLSPTGFVWLFVGVFTITSTITVGFVLAGAWLVLPFAGLEILVLAYVLMNAYLHYGDYESISLINDDVVVEQYSYKSFKKYTFQRYWVRVTLRETLDGTVAIFIGSHGKEIEFGSRYINKEERESIAKQLKQDLKIV
ncbi:MAG: DUF2244 domain-containing protein [Methylotenera sp.]|jgi:uncharacterized membrane protein|uniref:DUF2244 domain-containing protein n=1 Tax=Methylotenera sp. TaxID=2051956 RepID=UPI0027198A96|nr:DUF2244 domain-containing protein [Methylotenera sp.]MDO9151400.1 DUF2244 domain-containing protein [Methylotenera sp.]